VHSQSDGKVKAGMLDEIQGGIIMLTVKVSFADGDTITTRINGTEQEIRDWYAVGSVFNLGSVDDNMQRVTGIEFLN